MNVDQTPLSYISSGKYIFEVKGVKTVPIKGNCLVMASESDAKI